MTIQKFRFSEGDLLVAEVQPSELPPVRYKGKIWVRIGPRKAIANEAEEKILIEKRVTSASTFDALPCLGATIDDLDTAIFKMYYLPKAINEDVLLEDRRSVKEQLISLGFFDYRYDVPTNAGIILFGKSPERFLPGAYTQYVHFKGKSRSGEILSEYKFTGNLCTVLAKMDTFIEATIVGRRPVPVSALREEIIYSYPYWATRELLMNAVMHRDYESNEPVQFYEYDDRIELLNSGGLYGKARPENFPGVNDYRNPLIAEAMKVLGFVNRFSRGIMRVKDELKENGNGEPEFDLSLVTAFKVTEYISKKEREIRFNPKKDDHIRLPNGVIKQENGAINSDNGVINQENSAISPENGGIKSTEAQIIYRIQLSPGLNGIEIAERIGKAYRTVQRYLSALIETDIIEYRGSRKTGGYYLKERK
ncbi:ATP-binding protein [uncultured Bacteroides sp.]|uniref:ATP-binding protein n=1 Tax=uncultured Bacteroides sp. TaxID=162156 RepID=UPI002AAAA880|nr:ATP-binding protein [uncultured Bacteroides sp.]